MRSFMFYVHLDRMAKNLNTCVTINILFPKSPFSSRSGSEYDAAAGTSAKHILPAWFLQPFKCSTVTAFMLPAANISNRTRWLNVLQTNASLSLTSSNFKVAFTAILCFIKRGLHLAFQEIYLSLPLPPPSLSYYV